MGSVFVKSTLNMYGCMHTYPNGDKGVEKIRKKNHKCSLANRQYLIRHLLVLFCFELFILHVIVKR